MESREKGDGRRSSGAAEVTEDRDEGASRACAARSTLPDAQTTRGLGIREGVTENSAVCTTLLGELRDRGLPTDRATLLVLDGSKALTKASAMCTAVGRHGCRGSNPRKGVNGAPP
jgi:hypothetical protein